MAEATPEFDPRYDPRFQPGYEPQKHGRAENGTETAAAERSRRAMKPPPVLSSPDDGVAIFEADDLARLDDDDLAEAEREFTDASEQRLGPLAVMLRNPFLWLILVIGIGLLAWGWSSYGSAVGDTSTLMFTGFDSSREDTMQTYVASQVTLGLAPLAVLTGLLTLVGAVFFAAATWRRAHAAAQ